MKFSNPIPWVSFQVIYQVFLPKTVFFGLFITAPSTAADHPADGKNHL